MLIKSKHAIPTNEITDSLVFTQRRQIIKALGLSTIGLTTGVSNVFAILEILIEDRSFKSSEYVPVQWAE